MGSPETIGLDRSFGQFDWTELILHQTRLDRIDWMKSMDGLIDGSKDQSIDDEHPWGATMGSIVSDEPYRSNEIDQMNQ